MNEKGLLAFPEFDTVTKYLKSGERTEVTEYIREAVEQVQGDTDGLLVRNLLVWMNQNTERIHNSKDRRKFTRTAEEILLSGERTGCCDSSTLFTALARSKNIPAMQIITLGKDWVKKLDRREETKTESHYFTACYIRNVADDGEWVLIDSDKPVLDARDVNLTKLKLEDRNLDRKFYAFAYARDYSDIEVDGTKIDSIENMRKILYKAYVECDREDFKSKELGEER